MDRLTKDGFVAGDDTLTDNNWDDSVIVNLFEDAVRKHRTKNDQINGGLVRDQRTDATNGEVLKPTQGSGVVDSQQRRKKIKFNASHMQATSAALPAQSSNVEAPSSGTKFGSVLKSYAQTKPPVAIPTSSSARGEGVEFKVAVPGGSGFSVLDQTTHLASDGATGQQPESSTESHALAYTPTSAVEAGLFSSSVEAAQNDMLMAWYHSGYATGRYQALLECQQVLASAGYPADVLDKCFVTGNSASL